MDELPMSKWSTSVACSIRTWTTIAIVSSVLSFLFTMRNTFALFI